MGGSKPATTNTTGSTSTNQTSSPWAPAAGYFPPLYQQGQQNTQNIPTQTVAQANPTEQQALQMTQAQVPNLGTTAPLLADQAAKAASGFYTNPLNDPNFVGAVQASQLPSLRTLQTQILPGLAGQSISGGNAGPGPSAYGGSGLDLANAQALRDWTTNTQANAATMAQNVYGQGLNMINAAPALQNAANTQFLAPGAVTGQVGTQEQAYGQQSINNILGAFGLNQNTLQQFANLLTTGGYGNTTGLSQNQSTQVSTPASPSLATQILQGVLGGAGAMSSLFGGSPGGGASPFQNAGSMLGNIWSGVGNIFGGSGGVPYGVPGIQTMLAAGLPIM